MYSGVGWETLEAPDKRKKQVLKIQAVLGEHQPKSLIVIPRIILITRVKAQRVAVKHLMLASKLWYQLPAVVHWHPQIFWEFSQTQVQVKVTQKKVKETLPLQVNVRK